MRDLVLASKYKDTNIIFAVQNLNGNINHKIKELEYKIEILQSNDIEEVNKLIKNNNIDLIVIDHYKIDYKYEKQLSILNSQLSIMVLDDTYEKHYCNILLNHNISGDEKRYEGLVPENCELRCGSKYTLLRDEFYKQKKKRKKQFKIQNSKFKIFLAMGGTDHSNINIKILKVLKQYKNLKVNLATTTANQNLKELKKYCKDKKWINLYINSNKIAKLIRKSDFTIVTPSVILNEIYFMQVPFVAIQTADNQKDIYNFVKKEKKLILKQFDKNKLNKLIKIYY